MSEGSSVPPKGSSEQLEQVPIVKREPGLIPSESKSKDSEGQKIHEVWDLDGAESDSGFELLYWYDTQPSFTCYPAIESGPERDPEQRQSQRGKRYFEYDDRREGSKQECKAPETENVEKSESTIRASRPTNHETNTQTHTDQTNPDQGEAHQRAGPSHQAPKDKGHKAKIKKARMSKKNKKQARKVRERVLGALKASDDTTHAVKGEQTNARASTSTGRDTSSSDSSGEAGTLIRLKGALVVKRLARTLDCPAEMIESEVVELPTYKQGVVLAIFDCLREDQSEIMRVADERLAYAAEKSIPAADLFVEWGILFTCAWNLECHYRAGGFKAKGLANVRLHSLYGKSLSALEAL